jgi:hypothetical protein
MVTGVQTCALPIYLTTSNATVGSAVPANRQWTTKQVVITNTNTVDAQVYLAIGTAATASNRIFSALPIGANDTVVWDTALVLEATEQLYGYSDYAGVNITVVGWEKVTA